MFPHRFSNDLPPHAHGIEANAGISLARVRGRYIATPNYLDDPKERGPDWQDEQPPVEFEVPQLPSIQLEHMARLLRTVWNRAQRCATWLIYLNLIDHRWHEFLPPQICLAEHSQVDTTFHRCNVPSHRLRLAGTFRASPVTDPVLLASELPARDGIHLVWAPGNWMNLTAFAMCAGQPQVVRLEEVLSDDNAVHNALLDRLQLSDSAS